MTCKWVLVFSDEQVCERQIIELVHNNDRIIEMRVASKRCYLEQFTEDKVHGAYERLLCEYAN